MPQPLRDNFLEEPELRAQYSDQEIQEISTHLLRGKLLAWSGVPRLYIVLRRIGQLQSLDDIISHGINDYWFPFSAKSVQATTLSSTIQSDFLEAQKLVLTKAVDLEKNGEKKHFHFSRSDTIPFKGLGEIGRGGYATVDKVSSLFSRREYARKLFKRQNGGNKKEVKSFLTEVGLLKKIHHRHCVELIASYTDPKYFGIVMSPIADCNLKKFYISVFEEPEKLPILRTFFGCLISAVEYLHNGKIRHRDIKPENILVRGSDVYLTDFGISLDWENLSRGTTTADSGKTRMYCAPEVANHQQRNWSSDIWSLGCVFLEMCTVLKGRTIDEMRQFFKRRSDTHAFYANLPAIQDWSNNLQKCGPELDDLPLEWAASMLQFDRHSRPLAQDLHNTISECRSTSDRGTRTFCADCCVVEDEESTGGSASDGGLWAEDMDDDVTSPAVTDEIAKVAGPKSSVQEDLSGNGDSSVRRDNGHRAHLQRSKNDKGLFKNQLAVAVGQAKEKQRAEFSTSEYRAEKRKEAEARREADREARHAEYLRSTYRAEKRKEAEAEARREAEREARRKAERREKRKAEREAPIAAELAKAKAKAKAKKVGVERMTEPVSPSSEYRRHRRRTFFAESSSNSNDSRGASSADGSTDPRPGLDPMESLPYPVSLHQAPPFSVDRPDIGHGSSTARQNIVSSHIPSESPVHSRRSTYLPVSRHDFGASSDTFKIPLATTHSLVEPALSESLDTVSPIQANMQPARSGMQLFATSPEPETNKQLEGETSDELPLSEALEPDTNKQLEQGAIRQIQPAQEDLVNINGSRREYVSIKLQDLTPLSWVAPSALLKALKKDKQVMEYLIYNSPEIQTFPKEDPRYITRIVQLLIENGLDLNSEAYQDAKGRTPIFRVTTWSDGDHYLSLFSSMIKAGADLSIRMFKKKGGHGQSLFEAVGREGRVWAVAALIEHDVAKPRDWIHDLQWGAFRDKNSDGKVLQLLIDSGTINFDFSEAEISAYFSAACSWGSSGLVKFLLDAYPDKFDPKKGTARLTPLHIACEHGNLEVARLLIARGAPPNMVLDSKVVPQISESSPLFNASREGHAHVVKYLLEYEGGRIDVDCKIRGLTALCFACQNKRVEVARELLVHGANPNLIFKGSVYPSYLHCVAANGNTELTKLLLDHGASPTPHFSMGFRIFGEGFFTPLDLAKRNGHMKVARLLIIAVAQEKLKKELEGKKKKKSAPDTKQRDQSAEDTAGKGKDESVQDTKGKGKDNSV